MVYGNFCSFISTGSNFGHSISVFFLIDNVSVINPERVRIELNILKRLMLSADGTDIVQHRISLMHNEAALTF